MLKKQFVFKTDNIKAFEVLTRRKLIPKSVQERVLLAAKGEKMMIYNIPDNSTEIEVHIQNSLVLDVEPHP